MFMFKYCIVLIDHFQTDINITMKAIWSFAQDKTTTKKHTHTKKMFTIVTENWHLIVLFRLWNLVLNFIMPHKFIKMPLKMLNGGNEHLPNL